MPWTDTPAPSATLAPTASPTPPPYRLWSDARLPTGFQQAIRWPASFGPANSPETATHQITISTQNPASYWVYALAGPFHTIRDGITAQALHDFWYGRSNEQFEADQLWMTPETLALLSAWWGTPTQAGIQTNNAEQLLEQAWGTPRTWAILPFEQLEPRWKVLAIDGLSPLDQAFEPRDYELAIPFSLLGDPQPELGLPASNRNDDQVTHLVMTGVTALVRATAFTMERQGLTYPATDIGAYLQAADITHISNEVPFADDCPYPNPTQEGMRFCSSPAYIELLEAVGTDVVELTGDHFADWGSAAMLFTLQQYTDRGWLFYGGGENLESARQAALITDHGNPIAFIGCNAKGGGFAQASSSNPGAVACDFEWLEAEIQELSQQGYLVIGTFQHFEYYTYAAQPNQVRDAARLIEAGATLVSGSQAHQPQAFEFVNGRLVHHGLGNLFFDQLDLSEPARQAFIDEHIFYQGRHISTRLVTIYFVDYARPRIMTPAERDSLLQAVFAASGW
ncbi:MAG: CapA family protein [Anaerolineales bacterium]|nr:CapA family protein [Anaerolineales bacterium]